jgi:endonuclease-3
LDELFENPKIPLYHEDAYTLLIAVLLSAQCTDERVNKVTPKLFQRAKTPFEMVKLSPDEIEEIIRPVGLTKRKAPAIYNLSKILIEKYQGRVPNTFEALEELPGVGHKTASCVMSLAFQVDAFPVDTHIHRLSKRWGISKGRSVEEAEKDLKAFFPKKDWNKLHLQIIYYARTYCRAKAHDVEKCPICKALNTL